MFLSTASIELIEDNYRHWGFFVFIPLDSLCEDNILTLNCLRTIKVGSCRQSTNAVKRQLWLDERWTRVRFRETKTAHLLIHSRVHRRWLGIKIVCVALYVDDRCINIEALYKFSNWFEWNSQLLRSASLSINESVVQSTRQSQY